MNYWLMKSEPDAFSIDDLRACPKGTDHWDGIRNYQARNFMRDEMKKGDLVFFYHSSCDVPGVAGIMKVVRESYPDFTALDPESRYFDPKSDPANPRWYMVDVKFERKFSHVVSLSELRERRSLKNMQLLQKGNRLSIMPVDRREWDTILKMTETK
ncbi:MAG: EVE domain-containing protein [Gammaproteobacteria bacterium]|nr:EVE domain-containing protein [Gammaproteobacteria bacterium]